MRGIGRYLLPLMLLCAPGWLPGQYVGNSRPLAGAAILDSLAAKSDTAALRRVLSRLDSLAAASGVQDDSLAARKADRDFIRAGSNITVTRHGDLSRPDSVTIAGAAAGGGGGMPVDTTLYQRILGWPEDSATYGAFSGFRLLDNRTARADSATGDSLWSSVNALRSTGGNILVLPGDTIHDYRGTVYDSLSGAITKTVTVQGADRYRIILSGTRNSTGSAVFRFPVGRGAQNTAVLVFRDMTLVYNQANQSGIGWEYGNLTFERCKLDGEIVFDLANATKNVPQNSRTIRFSGCELNNLRLYQYQTKAIVYFQGCFGSIAYMYANGPYFTTAGARDSAYLFIDNSHLNIASWATSQDCPITLYITGSTIENGAGASFYMYGTQFISGSTFVPAPGCHTAWTFGMAESDCYVSGSGFHYVTLNVYNSSGNVSGCQFYGSGVNHGTGGTVRVVGNTFYGSTSGVAVNSTSNNVVTANSFTACTTGAATTGGSGNRLHGNHFYGCSTAITGTWATDTDNVSW